LLEHSEARAIGVAKSGGEAFEKSKAHALRDGYVFESYVETETFVFEIPIGCAFEFRAGQRSSPKAALKIGRSVGRIIVTAEIRQRLGAGADSIASLIP
jgi:hypothetical protein